MSDWDRAVVLWLHGLVTAWPWLAALAAVLANSGPLVLLGVMGVAGLWPGPGRGPRRRAMMVAGVALGEGYLLAVVLEHVLARPRPFVALGFPPLFPHAADSSFPSDHTLLGVALAAPFLWRTRALGVGLLALALLTGLARVAAGVHYPSDVLGSALLGLAVAGGADWLVARTIAYWPAPVARWVETAPPAPG
ncbi:MAG TPA: phosphatase PAP2 family protein [Chloroflexota bacterium]